jgi:hypothetical protein
MRQTVIALILAVLASPTAMAAIAGSPHVKKPREPNSVIARPGSSKSVSCRGVLTPLAEQPSVSTNGSSLPYDEFGLATNQPSQPRIGSAVSSTGLAVTELGAQGGGSANGDSLPYDEFGLATNQPSQPQIGCAGPGN